MAIQVPIGDVLQANQLGVVGGLKSTGAQENVTVRMEVYTGWVGPAFQALDSLTQEQAITFLPVDNQNKVRRYAADSLVDSTVTVSPATVAPFEDEATIFGVDGASVHLEGPQSFSGIGGDPFCLVLRVDLAGLNVNFHRFTYQVTVLFPQNVETAVLALGPDEVPA